MRSSVCWRGEAWPRHQRRRHCSVNRLYDFRCELGDAVGGPLNSFELTELGWGVVRVEQDSVGVCWHPL